MGTWERPNSWTLIPSGGLPPYTWTVPQSGWPPGISFSPSGVVSGAPTTAHGSPGYSIAAAVTDRAGAQFNTTFTMIVQSGGGSLPAVSCSASPNPALASQTVTFTAIGAGGTMPYNYSWSGAVNSGFSTSSSKSFQPNAAGSYTATVTLKDSSNPATSNYCSVSVQSGGSTLTITTGSPLPGAVAGVAYSQYLSASGGTPPYTWTLASGSLPPGLNLSSSGALTGTVSSTATYSFSLSVSDSASATASRSYTLGVGGGISITTTSLPSAGTGVGYAQAVAAAGGRPPYTWSLATGALPQGLSLSNDGTLSGTPGAVGAFSFSLEARDDSGSTATQGLSLSVAAGAPPNPNCWVSATIAVVLVALGDGTMYGDFRSQIDAAANNGAGWYTRVNTANLYTPGGTYSQGWHGGPTANGSIESIQSPTGSFASFGEGGYTVGAGFVFGNSNCGEASTGSKAYIVLRDATIRSMYPMTGVVGSVITNAVINGYYFQVGPYSSTIDFPDLLDFYPGVTGIAITKADGSPAAITGYVASWDFDSVNVTLDLTASGVTPGKYKVALTVFGITTNQWDFSVGDNTPYISSVNGALSPGSNTSIVVNGTGFGLGCTLGGTPTNTGGVAPCPGAQLGVCFSDSITCDSAYPDASVTGYSLWSDTQIVATLSAGASANGFYDLQVTSVGTSGLGFTPTPGVYNVSKSNRGRLSVIPLGYGLQVTSTTNSPNAVAANHCAYIDKTPQMPSITAKIVDGSGNPVAGSAAWRFRSSFRYWVYTNTTLGNTIPFVLFDLAVSPLVLGGTTMTWGPSDFAAAHNNDVPFGGDSEIEWTYTPPSGAPQSGIFYFVMCGMNPDFGGDYTDAQPGTPEGMLQASPYWFARRIANHESGMTQFNASGDPLYGYPAGYGMMQLDPVNTLDDVWNWQTNITDAIARLNTSSARWYAFWIDQVRQWQQFNHSEPEPTETLQNQSNPAISCTFRAPLDSNKVATSITGQTDTYWYGDAIVMKANGGGAAYISWNTVTNKWRWHRASNNPQAHNFVYEFCTCRDRDTTCQKSTPTQYLQ